jgi:hypothetical protein
MVGFQLSIVNVGVSRLVNKPQSTHILKQQHVWIFEIVFGRHPRKTPALPTAFFTPNRHSTPAFTPVGFTPHNNPAFSLSFLVEFTFVLGLLCSIVYFFRHRHPSA